MAFPHDENDDPLQPVPMPPPEPGPLPESAEVVAEELQAGVDELGKQLSAEDAAPETPTEEIRELPDVDVGIDAIHPDSPEPQTRIEDKNDAHRTFLQELGDSAALDADQLEDSQPEPSGEPAELPDPEIINEDLGEFASTLPKTEPPKPAEAVKPREFDGGPKRDFGQQIFPQQEPADDQAAAEADMRAALEQALRSSREHAQAVTELLLEHASELDRLTNALRRRRT